MSRIGKLPIAVPKSVKVTLAPGHVKVEGPRGQLERTLPADITIKQTDGELVFERPSEDFRHRAMHGLVRSLVANMVEGVEKGFSKNLELVGVGYRVAKQGEELVLNEDVGQVAANIRGMRPPEPYKGKGVRYRDEKVRRKAGKAGKGAKATA